MQSNRTRREHWLFKYNRSSNQTTRVPSNRMPRQATKTIVGSTYTSNVQNIGQVESNQT